MELSRSGAGTSNANVRYNQIRNEINNIFNPYNTNLVGLFPSYLNKQST